MWRTGWTPTKSWGKNNPFRYWAYKDCPSPLPTMAQECAESGIWRRNLVIVAGVLLAIVGAAALLVHPYILASAPVAFVLAIPLSQRIDRQGREIFGQAISCAVDPEWIYQPTGEDVLTFRARKLLNYPFVKGTQEELRAELVRLQPKARAWLAGHSIQRFRDTL